MLYGEEQIGTQRFKIIYIQNFVHCSMTVWIFDKVPGIFPMSRILSAWSWAHSGGSAGAGPAVDSPFWTNIIFWSFNYNWLFLKFTTVSKLGELALSVLFPIGFACNLGQNFPWAAPPNLCCCSLRSLFAARGIWLEAGTSRWLLASPFRKSWMRPCVWSDLLIMAYTFIRFLILTKTPKNGRCSQQLLRKLKKIVVEQIRTTLLFLVSMLAPFLIKKHYYEIHSVDSVLMKYLK